MQATRGRDHGKGRSDIELICLLEAIIVEVCSTYIVNRLLVLTATRSSRRALRR
jgi:hypothetical protein